MPSIIPHIVEGNLLDQRIDAARQLALRRPGVAGDLAQTVRLCRQNVARQPAPVPRAVVRKGEFVQATAVVVAIGGGVAGADPLP